MLNKLKMWSAKTNFRSVWDEIENGLARRVPRIPVKMVYRARQVAPKPRVYSASRRVWPRELGRSDRASFKRLMMGELRETHR